jgi:hypothetical protein
VKEGDRLLVFSDDNREPLLTGKLPDVHDSVEAVAATARLTARKLDVLVVRYRPELAAILRSLETHCVCRVTVLAPAAQIAEAQALLDGLALHTTRVELVPGDPLDADSIERVLSKHPDVALLLAPDVGPAAVAEADADQLITLLQVRRIQTQKRAPIRTVVEVRSPETERLAGPGDPSDFILAREIEGMLLAQELHALCLNRTAGAWLGTVYQHMLESLAAAIELRPMALYAGELTQPTFAHLAAVARRRGQIAVGVSLPGEGLLLLPERSKRFERGHGAKVVVLAPPHDSDGTEASEG